MNGQEHVDPENPNQDEEERRAPPEDPGKTPHQAEGQDEERQKPYPNEPGKTPGRVEGDSDAV